MSSPQTAERSPAGSSSSSEFLVTGMTCGNCARHVTEAVQAVPGVSGATVSLDTRRVSVRWAADTSPATEAVVSAIENAGYGAEVAAAETHGQAHGVSGWQITLLVAAIVTALLMAGEWVFGLGMTPWFRWVSFVLAAFVQVFAGAPFYRGAWNQLKLKRSNMDTLVALGSTTAFAYSAWVLFSGQPGHLYFMEAAAIITLISAGHWMEARVSQRASSALRQLLNLAPPNARRLVPGSGAEQEVPISELKIGDLVVLRPGDRVPTDGDVLEGDSSINESMLTGEPVPVDKKPGSRVYAGTVNVNGRLVMRVTATGDQTALAHIIAAVQRAQTSRANIQRLGDRVSSIFVPVVVLIAIAAGAAWGFAPESMERIHDALANYLWPAHPPAGKLAAAFITAAAVLIVACPCAMGLATPAAIMAGSNAAAQRGILIRDGVALEKAGTVTAVLFDKTGTLTIGRPAVVKTWPPSGAGDSSASLDLAATLAAHSNHPISRTIADTNPTRAAIANWVEVPGSGVQAEAEMNGGRKTLRLGSVAWLRQSGARLSDGEAFITEWSGQGATVVGFAAGDALKALFAVKDDLKSGAVAVVDQLKRQGLRIYLVTGDHGLAARSIAGQAGIPADHVFAEVRPERKAEFVRKLQQQGERVAFVGDGINDAPALEQADLGIAVSRASDVAREAADIILLRSEIEAVPEALGLARATLRTIKQNLFWAFFYNAAGVPLAALGFMSPVLCAAAMGLSDLIVIGNALRLRRWK